MVDTRLTVPSRSVLVSEVPLSGTAAAVVIVSILLFFLYLFHKCVVALLEPGGHGWCLGVLSWAAREGD